MRLYFVDNQWLDYDTIHNNYGYTKTPTEDISSFRDTQEETWGELLEGITGFYSDLEVVHYYRGTYFVQNYTGWHTLNELCYQCNLMPSEAETEGLTFTNGTELSKAARLLVNPFPGTDVESYKYLVQKRLDLGWLTEDGLREYGWSKYNPDPPVVETPDYYILDATTGTVLHSINSPLFSAKPSAVMISGNIEHIDNPPAEYIDVILAMKYDKSTGQFVANASSANDWWWSCVRNQGDKDRLTAFGVRVEDPRSSGSGISTGFCGPYGCINDSASNPSFSYEVIGVYSDIDGTTPISQDVSNFYTGRSATWPEVILIWNIASTPSYMTWKCRITKLSQ